MIPLILILTVIGLIIYLLIKHSTRNFDTFEKQGIKYEKPLPVIGNSQYLLTGNITKKILDGYFNFPNEKLIGMFEFTKRLYFIRSPNLIKQLAIKDFHHFQDHQPFVDSSVDELFGNALFFLAGKKWRDMRQSLSPVFTGSKMRIMFELINNCTKQFTNYLTDQYKENGLKSYKIKDLFSRYTNDVIATCAFGVECDSLKHPDNEIYRFGQMLLKFQKPSQIYKFMFMSIFPKITKILGMKVLDRDAQKKFDDLIIETMKIRKEKGIVRPDMLQLLIKLKDGQLSRAEDKLENESEILNGEVKKSWSDSELTAQCFQFFVAGFDTSSTAMCFMAYELAVNEDIQNKLIEEIDEIHESLSGKPLNYEALQKLKYMDMVFSEVLRKWPPLFNLNRICVKDYTYQDEDGTEFTIEKGDLVWFPCYALHMDPQYYPKPEKFDPERFSEENKGNIDMGTYIPFGIGPRNCIGLRFALMEIKALFYQFLLNFKFKVGEDTQVPIKLKKIGLVPEKEIQLIIEPRQKLIS